ncbi:MAG TPA: hypothetical protein PKZ42_10930 [Syntrophales bacterium]|nr:hypothetical protein [Syntrophales bacterium]
MALEILPVEYYNVTIEGQITHASQLLSTIAGAGVDFHAFKAIPVDPARTQFTLFAKNSSTMTAGAEKAGLVLDGPYFALLIKGDEKAGALADIYKKLSRAGIQVDEACGIADINAGYGVILYLKQEDCGKAITVLTL